MRTFLAESIHVVWGYAEIEQKKINEKVYIFRAEGNKVNLYITIHVIKEGLRGFQERVIII